MEVVCKLDGLTNPSAPDGREMSVAHLTESGELGEDNVLIIEGKNVRVTLGKKKLGSRIDIYIDYGASVILDGVDCPIKGGYVMARGSYKSDSTVLKVDKEGRLGIFFDGSAWRYYGMIYD